MSDFLPSEVLKELLETAAQPKELWAGLVGEAGEFQWPGYSRAEGKHVGGNEYHFYWPDVRSNIAPGTIVWAALYDKPVGGKLFGMSEIRHQDHPRIMPSDAITLRWIIKI